MQLDQIKSLIKFISILLLLALVACNSSNSNRFKLEETKDQKQKVSLSLTTGLKTTNQTNQSLVQPIFVINIIDKLTEQQTSEKIKIDIQQSQNTNYQNTIFIEFTSNQSSFYYGQKTDNPNINFFDLTFNKTILRFRSKCTDLNCETLRLCGYYLADNSTPMCTMALEFTLDKENKNYKFSKYVLLKEFDLKNETKILEVKCDDSQSICYNI